MTETTDDLGFDAVDQEDVEDTGTASGKSERLIYKLAPGCSWNTRCSMLDEHSYFDD